MVRLREPPFMLVVRDRSPGAGVCALNVRGTAGAEKGVSLTAVLSSVLIGLEVNGRIPLGERGRSECPESLLSSSLELGVIVFKLTAGVTFRRLAPIGVPW